MKPFTLPPHFSLHPEIAQALTEGKPIVALESAVITHGLPQPENLKLAQSMERDVRDLKAVPATVALLDGKVHIGLSPAQLERLASEKNTRKISRRDFGIAIARGECGGTTVCGTLIAARAVNIQVFATGGIGGVHRAAPFDVSADLPELGRSPLVVVCAGAKAILDLPNTLEYLETAGVPIVGYQTDDFPAFYSLHSGLKVNQNAQTPAEIAAIARAHWSLGLESAILVGNPPPADQAIPGEEMEKIISQALAEAKAQGIHGAATTPFLLSRVSVISHGASMQTNLALLRNNARLAARIAIELAVPRNIRTI
jgi:pseudouridine-5'-phosphate glycosidase